MKMDLSQLFKDIESGMTGMAHSEWLRRYLHDINDRLTRYQVDIALCQRSLGIVGDGLVAPVLDKYIEMNGK